MKFLASKGSTAPAAPATTPTLFDPSAPPSEQTNAFSLPPTSAELMWPIGISLDMHVYLSTSPNGDVFAHQRTMSYNKEELPSFVWGNITFGDWNEKRVADLNVSLPAVRKILCRLFDDAEHRYRKCKTTALYGRISSSYRPVYILTPRIPLSIRMLYIMFENVSNPGGTSL